MLRLKKLSADIFRISSWTKTDTNVSSQREAVL